MTTISSGYDPKHGRYLIMFHSVTEGQKHNNHLFRTDDRQIAQEWSNTLAFTVMDLNECGCMMYILPESHAYDHLKDTK